ncbi:MAG: trigger factor [Oscillospiraceae bacterium]|nr:trigger factor [Oscillospiraceae bacterium]
MNVKDVERRENNVVAIEVEVGPEEFEEAVERSYLKNRSQLSVPGFRKGRAPRKVVEGMYGSNIFYEDAMEEFFPKACREFIHKEGFYASSIPEPEVVSVGKEGFTFKIVFTVAPEAKLKAYKGIEAVKPSTEVTEDDIADSMKVLIERAMQTQSVDRPAKMGDIVNINFEGFIDGEAFKGGQADNFDLTLGSGQFIPGFEEQIVGFSTGDEKSIFVTFPEKYNSELGGKEAEFKIKVNDIREKMGVTLDDDFAKDVSEFETLDELRADIENKVRTRKENYAKRVFHDNLIRKIAEDMEVDIPDAMLQSSMERTMEEFSQNYGLPMAVKDVGVLASALQVEEEYLAKYLEESAKFRVQSELVLEAIAKAEDIQPTEEDIAHEYALLALQYQATEDEVKEHIDPATAIRNFRMKKAGEIMMENAVPLPEPEEEEEEAPAEEAETPAEEPVPAEEAETPAE